MYHLKRAMLKIERSYLLYESFSVYCRRIITFIIPFTVWFTKSDSLLPLAKKKILFKTGAEKYSLPKLTLD